MADQETVQVKIDPVQFAAVLRELKGLNPKLSTGIRKAVRAAAKLVMDDVAAEIRSYPAHRYQTGMREQLAKSLAVRINTSAGGSRQGVSIVSTGRLLPANKRALVKAMNRREFRHPVYASAAAGGGRAWVDELGMRYFRQSIVTRREAEVATAIQAALEQATEALK